MTKALPSMAAALGRRTNSNNGGGNLRGGVLSLSEVDMSTSHRGCFPGVIRGVMETGTHAGKVVELAILNLGNNEKSNTPEKYVKANSRMHAEAGDLITFEGAKILSQDDSKIVLDARWSNRFCQSADKTNTSLNDICYLTVRYDESGAPVRWDTQDSKAIKYTLNRIDPDQLNWIAASAAHLRERLAECLSSGSAAFLSLNIEVDGVSQRQDRVVPKLWDSNSGAHAPIQVSVDNFCNSMKPADAPEGWTAEEWAAIAPDAIIDNDIANGAKIVLAPVHRHMVLPQACIGIEADGSALTSIYFDRNGLRINAEAATQQEGTTRRRAYFYGSVSFKDKTADGKPLTGDGRSVAKLLATSAAFPDVPTGADPNALRRSYETQKELREQLGMTNSGNGRPRSNENSGSGSPAASGAAAPAAAADPSPQAPVAQSQQPAAAADPSPQAPAAQAQPAAEQAPQAPAEDPAPVRPSNPDLDDLFNEFNG